MKSKSVNDELDDKEEEELMLWCMDDESKLTGALELAEATTLFDVVADIGGDMSVFVDDDVLGLSFRSSS